MSAAMVRFWLKRQMARTMSDRDILKAHVKELFELRIHELVERFNITEEEASNFLFVHILLGDQEGKNNERLH